jgi:hypothetical protein
MGHNGTIYSTVKHIAELKFRRARAATKEKVSNAFQDQTPAKAVPPPGQSHRQKDCYLPRKGSNFQPPDVPSSECSG